MIIIFYVAIAIAVVLAITGAEQNDRHSDVSWWRRPR